MTNPLIKAVDQAALRTDIPDFRPGDSVRVHVRVIEGSRSRIQVFAGVVIARNAGGVQEAFTVRKVSFGIGVERTFPLHSPIIEKIEVERRGDVRRAKLYYLRGLRGSDLGSYGRPRRAASACLSLIICVRSASARAARFEVNSILFGRMAVCATK